MCRPGRSAQITVSCFVVSRAAHDLPVGSAARPRAAHITVVSPFVVSEGAHDFPELHLLLLQAFAAFACICMHLQLLQLLHDFASCTMYYVLCTMYCVLCTVYYVLCTMYSERVFARALRFSPSLSATNQVNDVKYSLSV